MRDVHAPSFRPEERRQQHEPVRSEGPTLLTLAVDVAWRISESSDAAAAPVRAFLGLAIAAASTLEERQRSARFLPAVDAEPSVLPLLLRLRIDVGTDSGEQPISIAARGTQLQLVPAEGTQLRRDWIQLWRASLWPPEASGKTQWDAAIGPSTDSWALGAVLHGVLHALRPPFAAPDAFEALHAKMTGPPPPSRRVPPVVDEIVQRLLHPNPACRYASAAAVRADLEACLRLIDANGRILGFPLDAARVEGARTPVPSGLHGREAAKAELVRAGEAALVSPGGRGVLAVYGGAGEGKSALLAAAVRALSAPRRGWGRAPLVAAGKFDQVARGSLFAAAAACARDLAAQALASQADFTRVAERLLALFGTGRAARATATLCALVPELEAILSPRRPSRRLSYSGSSGTSSGDDAAPAAPVSTPLLLRCFRDLFHCFADLNGALILIFDDCQWADEASVQLLQRLCAPPGDGEGQAALLLCVSYRPQTPDVAETARNVRRDLDVLAASCSCHVTEVSVGPLDQCETLALVEDALQWSAPRPLEPLAATLHRATLGNAHAIVEALRELYSSGALRRSGGEWQWDAAAVEALAPTGDAAAALSRSALPSLGDLTRRLLMAAALLGIRFGRDALALAADAPAADVDVALAAAVDAGVVRCCPDGAFAFAHDKLQAAALAGTDPEERFAVGLRLAGRVVCGRGQADGGGELLTTVAELLASGIDTGCCPSGPQRAVAARACLRAGQRAASLSATVSAVRLFVAGEAALCGPPEGPVPKRRRSDVSEEQRALLLQLALELARCLVAQQRARAALDKLHERGPLAASRLERLQVLHGKIQACASLRDEAALSEHAREVFVEMFGEAAAAPLAITNPAIAVRSAIDAFGPGGPEALAMRPMGEDAELHEAHWALISATVFLRRCGQIPRSIVLASAAWAMSASRAIVPSSPYWVGMLGINLALTTGDYDGCSKWCRASRALAAHTKVDARHYGYAVSPSMVALPTGRERFADLAVIADASAHAGRLAFDGENAVFIAFCNLHLHWSAGRSLAAARRAVAARAALLEGASDRIRRLRSDWAAFLAALATGAPDSEGSGASSGGEGTTERLVAPAASVDWARALRRPLFRIRLADPAVGLNPIELAIILSFRVGAALLAGRVCSESTWADVKAMRERRVPFAVYDVPFLSALFFLRCRARRTDPTATTGPWDAAADEAALATFAKASPVEFGPRHAVGRAALQASLGDEEGALDCLVSAIDGARSDGSCLLEGMVAEAASELAAVLGRAPAARLFASAAARSYTAYGAGAKACEVEPYPPRDAAEGEEEAVGGAGGPAAAARQLARDLDVQGLFGAMRRIAEAAVPSPSAAASPAGERVAAAVAQALGATRCVFAEHRDAAEGAVPLEVAAASEGAAVGKPLEDCAGMLPLSVARFVERTAEPLVLTDAGADARFAADPYLATRAAGAPLSVVCVPVMHEFDVIGVLYAESSAMAGAFALDRAPLAQLLGAQAAACLRGARFSEEAARARELALEVASLAKLDRAKDGMLADTAHEMRTPCAGISGMASLLREAVTDEQQREMAEIVQQSADHLLALLSSLVDMAAIRNGGLTLARDTLDLRSCVNESLATVLAQAHRNGVHLQSFVHPRCPTLCLGDRARFKQVIINFAGNSVKFYDAAKPPAERLVSVEVAPVLPEELVAAAHTEGLGADAADETVYIDVTVRDTGPGMTSEGVARLFSRFSQLGTTSSKAQGTGLGLAICKSLVFAMRGTGPLATALRSGEIDVQSALGAGTSFRFRVALEPVPGARPIAEEDPLREARGGRPAAVAVVGGRALCSGAARVLRALGHAVYEGHDLGALAAFPTRPDVLLVDDALADGDAARLAEALRRAAGPRPLPPAVLVVDRHALLSGTATREAVSASFASVLAQPLQQCRLLIALAAAVESGPEPAVTVAPAVSARVSPPAAALTPAGPTRILVVEDNGVNQIIVQKFLKQAGYAVEVANDGVEALQAVARDWEAARGAASHQPFAMVFMDCEMPRCGGLEATALVRAWERERARPPLPIVAFTANTAADYEQRCLESGMDAHLAKPAKREAVVAAAQRWAARPVPPRGTPSPVQPQLAAAAATALAAAGFPAAPSPPAVAASVSSERGSAPLHGSPGPPRQSRPPRVLLAEADDAAREFERATLLSAGAAVVAVASNRQAPAAAAAAAAAEGFDLAILDGDDAEGACEAARALRAAEAAAGRREPSPVLALAMRPLEGERERCLASGVTEYGAKATRRRDVIWLLARWLPAASSPAQWPQN